MNSRIAQLRGPILLSLFALTLIFVTFVDRAGAATYNVHSCSDQISTIDPRDTVWEVFSSPGLGGSVDCPNGLTVAQSDAVPSDIGAVFGWKPTASVSLESVTFDVSGGDTTGGVKYAYTNCVGCGELTPLFERDLDDDDTQVTLPLDDGGSFQLVAYCLPGPCTHGRPLTLRNFEFVVHDDDPPYPYALISGSSYASIDDPLWTNDSVLRTDIWGYDFGGGVMAAAATLTNGLDVLPLWNEYAVCRDFSSGVITSVSPCPEYLYGPKLLDISEASEGVHEFELSATDAFGHEAKNDGLHIGIDRTAPEPPQNLQWAGEVNRFGWTGDPEVRLTWNFPDAVSSGEAPLVHTGHVLRRVDGPVSNSDVQQQLWNSTPVLNLPSDGRFTVSAYFVDKAGNIGVAASKEIGYDSDVPLAPTLHANEWLSREDLIEGHSQVWDPATDQPELESGLCGYAVEVDRSDTTVPQPAIDLGPDATAYRLPANLGEGDHFAHVRAVSCADLGSETSTEQIQVDLTAPEINLSGVPTQAWTNEPLMIGVHATDALSGVSTTTATTGGLTESAAGDTLSLPLGNGRHEIVYSATDVAGNSSEPQTLEVGVDVDAPEITVFPKDADAPRSITVEASDQLSGLAGARFEYRPTGSNGGWLPLPGSAPTDVKGENAMRLKAEIPDEQLPAGGYEFRVLVNDLAGNTRSQMVRSATLPLREAVHVSAAIADVESQCVTGTGKRCSSVSKCRKSLRCKLIDVVVSGSAAQSVVRPYNGRRILVGDAFDSDGDPLADRQLTLVERTPEINLETRRTVMTDSKGAFTVSLSNGPSRDLNVEYAGDALRLPATGSARLGVRANTTMHPSRSRVRGGTSVRFRGRVTGAADFASRGGKYVVPQFFSLTGWQPTLASPLTDARGRFAFNYRVPRVKRKTTILFRVNVPGQFGWPYESGSSKPVRLTILPD